MLNWIDFATVVIVLVVFLVWIPLMGTTPKKWRDYTVWSAYLILAVLASNWVISEATQRIF